MISNPWLIVGAIVGAIALSSTAYFKGRSDGTANVRAEWMAAELAAARASNDENIARMDVSAAIGRAVGAAMAARDAQTKQLLREVKDVVTAETDRRYPLPCGLVRLHDAAALGRELSAVAACAGQPDDAAAAVGASDLAAILAANYGSCHLTSDQVRGWQDFYENLRTRERVPLGDATRVALVSFVFNVGAGAFERSTLLMRLNAGAGAAACDELLRWTYAGGRQLPGLVKRRQAERALCVEGFGALPPPRPVPLPLARPERA